MGEAWVRWLHGARLDAPAGDEAEDEHLVRLAEPVRARQRLDVVVRVPVRVVEHDGVGGGEVDAQAARARREQEDEPGWG